MKKKLIIDPWGSFLIKDYEKLIGHYGIEPFTDELLSKIPNPNRLMRRKVIFGHTDLGKIIDDIINKRKFYALTGIMPTSEKVHFGTKLVIENIDFFQEHGAKTYVLVADLEAAATRGITLEEARERALNFHIPAYIALGLNPKKTTFYFQSQNEEVKNLAYLFSKRITLNEFRSIYGSTDPARIMSSLLQAGDILFPQLEGRMNGVIPVGVDQSPHIRLTRDIARRTRSTFNFALPAGIYHKFTPSLRGDLKMSKSKPSSCISIPESSKAVRKKMMNALTGGRKNEEEQRRLGGQPEKCTIFEMYKQHLVESDEELEGIYRECKEGRILCGGNKERAADMMTKFLMNFDEKFKKAQKIVPKLKFIE